MPKIVTFRGEKLGRLRIILSGAVLLTAIASLSTFHYFERPQSNLPSNSEVITIPSEDPWSFFHPSWINGSSTTASGVRELVADPEGRVDGVFSVPPSLATRMGFWMEIYSRFNSHMRVVHDRHDLSVVYGYIDFRPLYRSAGVSRATDVKAQKLERVILKELRGRLKAAAGARSDSELSTTEKAQLVGFLSSIGALSKAKVQEFSIRIRTQTGQSDMFVSALYRSRDLLPHIESVFRKHDLPSGLSRIPFVESSFNVRAHSKIGAVGIWQFTPETARELIHGEKENLWSDPLKQTSSAAKMLKRFRAVLPDWGITITSYNSGVGRLRRLVEKHRIKSVEGLIALQGNDALGFAGKNFYAEFLAANLVEAYKEKLIKNYEGSSDYELVLKTVAQ